MSAPATQADVARLEAKIDEMKIMISNLEVSVTLLANNSVKKSAPKTAARPTFQKYLAAEFASAPTRFTNDAAFIETVQSSPNCADLASLEVGSVDWINGVAPLVANLFNNNPSLKELHDALKAEYDAKHPAPPKATRTKKPDAEAAADASADAKVAPKTKTVSKKTPAKAADAAPKAPAKTVPKVAAKATPKKSLAAPVDPEDE